LDFNRSAKELEQQVLAYYPWPGCYIEIGSERLKVIKAEVVTDFHLDCCKFDILDDFPIIGTSSDALLLRTVQPAGKKPMSGDLFLRGYRNWKALKFSED
jgi:methionyl-tRNA formyltransferase